MFYISQQNSVPYLSTLNEIPFDYFLTNEFYLHGEDDPFYNSILVILPQLLKYRFPDCKVFIIYKEYMSELNYSIFINNPWIDDIIQTNQNHDFYKLNTVITKDLYLKLTYENALINQMLDFWKFPKNVNSDKLLPEIYFDNDDIDYISSLNNSWCNNEQYLVVVIKNPILPKRMINIINSFNLKNIIIMPNSYFNSNEFNHFNVLDLNEFIIPDKIILGLIKFSKACFGTSNYFNIMRQKDNIYSMDNKQLKNINYINEI